MIQARLEIQNNCNYSFNHYNRSLINVSLWVSRDKGNKENHWYK